MFDVMSGNLVTRVSHQWHRGEADADLQTNALHYGPVDKNCLATGEDTITYMGCVGHQWSCWQIARCLTLSLFRVHRAPAKGVCFPVRTIGSYRRIRQTPRTK